MGTDEVMTQQEAWRAYDRWIGDDRVLFLDEPSNVEVVFRALTGHRRADSKSWADAYLAAFADVAGMRFVTFDRAFQGKVNQLLLLD
jgi:predicted nucleic acid-binding protein